MTRCLVAIVDALGSGDGVRYSSRDAVGCGPRRIAGVLESNGLDTKIIQSEEIIRKPSLIDSYDVLMVSAMSMDIGTAQQLIRIWRNRRKDKPAIIGGPIASEPQKLLHSGYDTVVVGEGENSLLQMLRAGMINGALSNQFEHAILLEGKLRELGHGEHAKLRLWQRTQYDYAREQETLDQHEPSTSHISDYRSHTSMRFYVELVRGCSNFLRTTIALPDGNKCTDCQKCRNEELEERIECPAEISPGCGFCAVPSLFGPPRSRNKSKIIQEVRDLVKSGARRIVLSASDFLDYQRDKLVLPHPLTDPKYPPPNINEIESLLSGLALISKELKIGENDSVYISVENVKPCLFNDEIASVIAEYLPNSTIHFGCETGSEEHSRALGRPSTPLQTLEAVRIAAKCGLRPYVYFIHGLPGQTSKTARDTVDLMQEMVRANVEKLTIYRFKPLPLSAFAGFPPAPPAKTDKNSNEIERVARRLNLKSKLKLIGRTMDVIASRTIRQRGREGTITYPVSDGPVVLLSKGIARQGERLKVKVTEVLSDRLVRGERF